MMGWLGSYPFPPHTHILVLHQLLEHDNVMYVFRARFYERLWVPAFYSDILLSGERLNSSASKD